MIRVVIADDHAVVRSGLQQLLDSAPDITVLGTASDGAQAAALVQTERPDVVLMDLSMPGVGGIEAIRLIRSQSPTVHVVVLTSFSDRERIPEGAGPQEAHALTAREREVLSLVGKGLPNKLIARELSISEKTVKSHLTRVFRHIGVSDRTQAALWAQRHDL